VSEGVNKDLVRRYFEKAWIELDAAAVDEFMAPDYVEHAGIPGSRSTGREALKQVIRMYRGAFPDLRNTIEDVFAEGDRVAYRWTAIGTHLGEWAGIPPTGNHLAARGISIYRISGGRLVEGWTSIDLSRSEEELRWSAEGRRTGQASPEDRDTPSETYSSTYDALIQNLTWRLRAEEARERERIEHELRVARQIQEALLPEAAPEFGGWRLAARYRPAREVGGDFYDFLELPDGRLGLVVGDATGHGMPAALVMATARGMLRAVAQSSDSPGKVLARVNDALCPDIPSNTFVTCFYAVLDPESGRLRYANAGHDPPYRRHHGGGASELRATGMPLGLMPSMSYEERETWLEQWDSVLFYSDGLVEAHDPRRRMFGFPRLRELVAAGGAGGGEELSDFVLAELERFTEDGWEQEDDITLVTLQRSPHRVP
jgi:steroid delta-isomerase-like uncharacterized protein